MDYDPKYLAFFDTFNAGQYYECHDLLEDIWMEQRSNKFLQGLLQMSVALYHYQNGNIKGARTLFASAHRYLQPYQPRFWDVDVELVISYIERCLSLLPSVDRLAVSQARSRPLPVLKLYLEGEGSRRSHITEAGNHGQEKLGAEDGRG